MQEQEELHIKKLAGTQCRGLRPLWEEAFSAEESPAFTELYFKERAPGNRGYGLYRAGRLVSMLYLTPYQVNLRERAEGCPHILYYIVGVATAKDCRHRGYMTRLLREALQDMRLEGLPFTYLTPAAPAIYEPFGFRYIGRKPVWEFDGTCLPPGDGSEATDASAAPSTYGDKTGAAVFWKRLGIKDFELLARRAEEWLSGNGRISVKRDAAYYADRAAELEAEDGGVYGWFPCGDAMRGGLFRGAALLLGNWRQEPAEGILEAFAWEEKENFPFRERREKPSVMGRVLNAEALLSLSLRAGAASAGSTGTALPGNGGERRGPCRLWLEDPILPENTGAYEWRPKLAQAVRLLPEIPRKACSLCLTAAELTEVVFGQKQAPSEFTGLHPLTVFLNEIV